MRQRQVHFEKEIIIHTMVDGVGERVVVEASGLQEAYSGSGGPASPSHLTAFSEKKVQNS